MNKRIIFIIALFSTLFFLQTAFVSSDVWGETTYEKNKIIIYNRQTACEVEEKVEAKGAIEALYGSDIGTWFVDNLLKFKTISRVCELPG